MEVGPEVLQEAAVVPVVELVHLLVVSSLELRFLVVLVRVQVVPRDPAVDLVLVVV